MRKAVVDVGSNSVLLVVAERTADGWASIVETSEVTGLGADTKRTGVLSEESMAKTLAALHRAFSLARDQNAEEVVAAATMAARIASNTSEFLERAKLQGTPVVVLSGEDEAGLGLRSVVEDPQFAAHDRLSIVDVGGHSTEIVTADRGNVVFRKSHPIGTLALRSGTMNDESPDQMARLHALQEIDDAFGFGHMPGGTGHVVALGATATNLVTTREKMAEWEPEKVHGAHLEYEEIGRAVGWLCAMSDAQRAALAGLEKGREGTIHIGALILERALFALRAEGCSVSVRGWRHALLDHSFPVRHGEQESRR